MNILFLSIKTKGLPCGHNKYDFICNWNSSDVFELYFKKLCFWDCWLRNGGVFYPRELAKFISFKFFHIGTLENYSWIKYCWKRFESGKWMLLYPQGSKAIKHICVGVKWIVCINWFLPTILYCLFVHILNNT